MIPAPKAIGMSRVKRASMRRLPSLEEGARRYASAAGAVFSGSGAGWPRFWPFCWAWP